MKKIFALALVCAMMLCVFAGCGENEADSTTIKIGGIGPTTGGAAIYGTAVKNAAELAVDEINAHGGVAGLTLEFEWQDDEHNAEKAVSAYNLLVDNGMQVLVGTVTSDPCKAVVKEAEKDNIFMLTPSGSAVAAIDAPNAFRVCFSDPNQGIGAADYIKTNNVGEKVAVIYNSADVYSAGIYEKFAAQAKEIGLEIVTSQAFTTDTATDFSTQIQAVKDSGADLVFLPIYYQEAALILDQANTAGLAVKFFGCDGLDGIIPQLGDKAALAEGVMLLTPFAADAEDEKTKAFTAAYVAKYNETPNQFAADAYDAVYIIKAAIEKAGVTDGAISASDLCDKIVAEMTSLEFDGVTGLMTWSADGEPAKSPKAMIIKDGSYKAM